MVSARKARLAVLAGAVLLALTTAAPASAVEAPTRFVSRTLYTDTLPTTVTLGLRGYGSRTVLVNVCAKYRAGWPRDIRVTNGPYVNAAFRVPLRDANWCVTMYPQRGQGVAYSRIHVAEDIIGPWNPSARADVYVW